MKKFLYTSNFLFILSILIIAGTSASPPSYAQTQDTYPWADAIAVPEGNADWGYTTCPPDAPHCTNHLNDSFTDGGKYGVSDPRGYEFRNCTSYVAWKINQVFGINLPDTLGDAKDWGNNLLKNKSYSQDITPRAGDIAVWENGTDGHVAYVYKVENGNAYLDEYNIHGNDGNFSGSRMTCAGCATNSKTTPPADLYIHVGTLPVDTQTPTKSTQQNNTNSVPLQGSNPNLQGANGQNLQNTSSRGNLQSSGVQAPTDNQSSKSGFFTEIIDFFNSAFSFFHIKNTSLTQSKNQIADNGVVNSKVNQTNKNISTNLWIGKDNNNWNDAYNWSLGVPTNNQNIEINTQSFEVLKDNIQNLTINKLIIGGNGVNITGDTLSITDGISVTCNCAETNANNTVAQVYISNLINFTANQTIQTSGKNLLTTLYGMNIGNNTLQFITSGASKITMFGSIIGTGEIDMPANAANEGNIEFDIPSPKFNGKVIIGSGNNVQVGNEYPQTGEGNFSVDAFGDSNIEIMSGGVMTVSSAGEGAEPFIVKNNISMSGNGMSKTGNTGSYTGAIQTCITRGEEGCDSNVQVNLTGKVTLLANTELGAAYGLGYGEQANSAPSDTTVTYLFSQPVIGKYSLTAVPNSNVVIKR